MEDSLADIYLFQRAVEECSRELRVWVVRDGREALAFVRNEPPFEHVPSPGLIILDLHLTQLHGDQVLPKIRRLPAYQATPTVVLSVAPPEREEARCLQLGANAYVQKAPDFDVYFSSLKAIVTHWLRAAGTE